MKTRSLIWSSKQKEWIKGNCSPISGTTWGKSLKTTMAAIADRYGVLNREYIWRMVPDPSFPSVRAPNSSFDNHAGESSDYSAHDRPYTVTHMYQAKSWAGSYYPSDASAVRTWAWAAQDADKNKNIFRIGNAGGSYSGTGVDLSTGYVPGSRYFYIGQWSYANFWNLFKRGGGYDKLDTGEMGDALTTAWTYAMTGSGTFAQCVGIWLARLAYFMEEPGTLGDLYDAFGSGGGGYSVDEWFSSGKVGGGGGRYASSISNALDSSFLGSLFGNGGYERPNGDSTQGFRLGTMYDAEWIGQVIQMYELCYDALDDQTLLAFLDGKAMTYSGLCKMRINGTGNYDGNILRRLIEDKLITPILEQAHERRVYGNIGRTQRVVMDAAIVLDDNEYENLLINCDGSYRLTGYQDTLPQWKRTNMSVIRSVPSPLGSGGSWRDAVTFYQSGSDDNANVAQTLITGASYDGYYPRRDEYGNQVTLTQDAKYFFGGWMRAYPVGTDRLNTDFNDTPAADNPTAVRVGLWVTDTDTNTIENYPSADPDKGPTSINPQATVVLTGALWSYFKVCAEWPYAYPPNGKALVAQIRNSDGTADNYANNPNVGFTLWRPRLWQSGVGLDHPSAHFSFQVTTTGTNAAGTAAYIRQPRTKRWIENWLFKEGAPKSDYDNGQPASGWYPYYINNFLFGDGTPAAQGDYQDKDLFYQNNIYRSVLKSPLYSGHADYDPFNIEKFHLGTLNAKWRTILSGNTGVQYRTNIGDGGEAAQKLMPKFVNTEWYAELYGDLKTPEFAQYAQLMASGKLDNSVHYALWHPNPNIAKTEMNAAIASLGPKPMPTLEINSHTMGILRNKRGDAGVWFWWGLIPGYDGNGYKPDGERFGDAHSHRDCLNFGIFASGYDLSPDLGYPVDFDSRQYNWNMQSLAHNVVLVGTGLLASGWTDWPSRSRMLIFGQDDESPNLHGGRLVTAFTKENIRYVEAEAPHAYDGYTLHDAPQYIASGVVKEYRRALVMVDIQEPNARDWYLVDINKVVGGQHHLYSFHGPFCSSSTSPSDTNITSSGLTGLSATLPGTYAGESYSFGSNFLPDPRWASFLSKDPGHTYIENCKKVYDEVSGFYLQWNAIDFWSENTGKNNSAALRLWAVNGYSDITLGQGMPNSVNGSSSYRLDWFLGHRTGGTIANPLASTFVSVFEVTSGNQSGAINTNAKISGVFEKKLVDSSDTNGAEALAWEIRRYGTGAQAEWMGTSIAPNPLRETKDGKLKWRGRFCCVSVSGGNVVWSTLHGGSYLEYNGQVLISGTLSVHSGTITSFSTTPNYHVDYRNIETTDSNIASISSDKLVGRVVRVNSTTQKTQNSAYVISDVERDGATTKLKIKDVSFVFGIDQKYNYGAGLIYSFRVGDTFEIMTETTSILEVAVSDGIACNGNALHPDVPETWLIPNFLIYDALTTSDSLLFQGFALLLFELVGLSTSTMGTRFFNLEDSVNSHTSVTDSPDRVLGSDRLTIKENIYLNLTKPSSLLVSGINVRTALETPGIRVTYTTPESNQWKYTIITRKTKSYPTSYDDGVIVHSGLRSTHGSAAAVTFEDYYQMRYNTIYYYTFFTHSDEVRTGYLGNSLFTHSGVGGFDQWTEGTGNFVVTSGTNVTSPVPGGSNCRITATGSVPSGTALLTQNITGLEADTTHTVDISYRNVTTKRMDYRISISGSYWDGVTGKWISTPTSNVVPISSQFTLNSRLTEQFTSWSGVGTYEFSIRTNELYDAGDRNYIFQAQIYNGEDLVHAGNYVTVTGVGGQSVDAALNNDATYFFDQYRTIGKAFSGKR